jgi:hypothetical protein
MLDAALSRLVECPTCGYGVEDFQPGVTDTTYQGLVYHPRCLKHEHPELFCVVPSCHTRTDEAPCTKHPRPLTLEQKLEKSIELTAKVTVPCEMAQPYPLIDRCRKPTTKGWLSKATNRVMPACDDCLKDPRFRIPADSIRPLI